jgi:SAM-dependent methyltransferase
VSRIVLPDSAEAFWDGRYAGGLVYGTEPTSVARRLVELFRLHRLRSILDAGCGSGRDTLLYAREGFDATGADLSGEAVRRAQERARAAGLSATFLRDNLLDSALPRGSFDAVVAVHLVHLLPEDARRSAVNQFWRLARDGGLVAMANYSTAEPGLDLWEPFGEPNTRVDPKGKLVHFFAADELSELLPPGRFDLLLCEEVELAEVPDGGPVTHREWLTVARKICPC